VSLLLGVLLQVSVSVQVPDTITARAPATMTIRATAAGNNAPQLTSPTVAGASLQLVTDLVRLGGGFGQAVATREIRYLLRAPAAGRVVIAQVAATLGREQVLSSVKEIVVLPPPRNAVPSIVMRAPLARTDAINFHSLVSPDTVWAGEQVTVQVGVFIDAELRSRLQRNPEYVAPSVEGAVAFDLPVANDALASRTVDGIRYQPYVYPRALFPLRAGTLTIPSSRLGYSIGGRTIFGREERKLATTAPRSVFVREIPITGRPVSFTGAVGVYTMTANVERATGRVGDAVQLTVRVEGVGNVKLLPAPKLTLQNVTINASGETISVDTSDLLVRGSKTFRYQLTPQREGEIALGDVRYAFFNPVSGTYQELAAALGTLRVAPGSIAASDESGTPQQPVLPLQPWGADSSVDVTDTWWYRTLIPALAAPWLALIGARIVRAIRSRRRLERRRTRRNVEHDTTDPAGIRRDFIEGLTPLIALRRDQPVGVDDVVRRLRKVGVTPSAAEAAGAMLSRLDQLTFGVTAPPRADLIAALLSESASVQEQLRSEISTTARQRLWSFARGLPMLVVATGVLQAQSAAFVTGVKAYGARQYTAAAAAFAEAARDEPANAAIWTNLGAAHWMRADTAGAVVAWQRSARLAPRANRATVWLEQRMPSSDLQTMITPVTPNATWLLLLGVTALLSVLGALMRFRHRTISNTALIGSVIAVSVCALLSIFAQRSRDAVGLVVVRRAIALRNEPLLAGEAGARARGGELATIQESRGTWRFVQVSAGRAGWVEGDALRSIAYADGRDVAAAELRIATESAEP
jgi:BatD DUF11 like domain